MVLDTSKLLSGSWRSTVVGLLGAIVLAVYPLLQGGKPTREQLIQAALCAIAGYVVKDSNVTGGTKPNPDNSPAAVVATTKSANPVVPEVKP